MRHITRNGLHINVITKNHISCYFLNCHQNLINKIFLPTFKKSKLGYLLRTHLLSNTEIYILKKNNDKLLIDSSNLNNSTCNLSLLLKGMWITESNYGLYWEINSIQVLSFKS